MKVRLHVRIEGTTEVDLDDAELQILRDLYDKGYISVDDLPFEVDIMEVANACSDPEVTDFEELGEE